MMDLILEMNHHGRGFGPAEWFWLVVVGMVVLVIAVFVYWQVRQSDGLSRTERRELDSTEAEILAMLRQTGRPLSQAEIADILTLDADDIGEAAQHLEVRNLIQRQWSSEQQTYIIISTGGTVEDQA